jgi:hypothetical protein
LTVSGSRFFIDSSKSPGARISVTSSQLSSWISDSSLLCKFPRCAPPPPPLPACLTCCPGSCRARRNMGQKQRQQVHTSHTSNITPHTSHLTPHTSHLTPHTSHLTPHTSHLTPHTSHLTPHTSHLTPHTSHLTPHTSHLTPHTSFLLRRHAYCLIPLRPTSTLPF